MTVCSMCFMRSMRGDWLWFIFRASCLAQLGKHHGLYYLKHAWQTHTVNKTGQEDALARSSLKKGKFRPTQAWPKSPRHQGFEPLNAVSCGTYKRRSTYYYHWVHRVWRRSGSSAGRATPSMPLGRINTLTVSSRHDFQLHIKSVTRNRIH